jgi:hypothetical protein
MGERRTETRRREERGFWGTMLKTAGNRSEEFQPMPKEEVAPQAEVAKISERGWNSGCPWRSKPAHLTKSV